MTLVKEEQFKYRKLKSTYTPKRRRSLFSKKYSPLELVELSLVELHDALNRKKRKDQENAIILKQMRSRLQSSGKDCDSLTLLLLQSRFLFLYVCNLDALSQGEQIEFTLLFSQILHKNTTDFVSVYMLHEEGVRILRTVIQNYTQCVIACVFGALFREFLHNAPLLHFYLEHAELLLPLFSECSHSQRKDTRRDVLLSIQDLLIGHPECGELPHVHIAIVGFPLLLDTPFVDVQIEGLRILYNYLTLPTTASRLLLDCIPLLASVFALFQSHTRQVVINACYVMKHFIFMPSDSVYPFLLERRNQIVAILLAIPCPKYMGFGRERQEMIRALQSMA